MTMEREVKLKVDDMAELLEGLGELGASQVGHRIQIDHYLDMNDGLLSGRGDALRIREDGESCFITYKGKLLNDELKLREELETQVGDCETMLEIMRRIGFTIKLTVKKVRDSYKVSYKGLTDAVVEVDQVEGLGSFIEIEVKGSMEVQSIRELAERLGVKWLPIREGYADLLAELRKH